ncbi:MAG: BamA/TamA family outer membrane protein [Bacteroidota bacterium]
MFCFICSTLFANTKKNLDVRDSDTAFKIFQFTFDGNHKFTSEEILSLLASKKNGRDFSQHEIELHIETVLTLYEENGFPFTKISIDTTAELSDTLIITMKIEEGPLVYIERLQFDGNDITKNFVLLRECGIQRAELYNQKKIVQLQQRLKRLNIFTSVEPPDFFLNENGGVLLCKVHEGRMNSFDGIIGFIPATSTTKNFINGSVNISFHNLFGTNRKAQIRWMRESYSTYETFLQYNEPWFLDYPVLLQGNFSQHKQDSLFVKTSYTFQPSFVAEPFTIAASVSFESITPAATFSNFPYSSVLYFGVNAKYDNRDDLFFPTEGYLFSIESNAGNKQIPSNKTIQSRRKFFSDFEFYYLAFSRQVLSLGLHTKSITGNELDQSDLFRFGGINSLRGYRENIFLGDRIVRANFEYRFLISSTIAFFPFADVAYFSSPALPQYYLVQNEQWKAGFGIGLRFHTKVGNISTSFAFGEGNSFSQAKIHFGFIAGF